MSQASRDTAIARATLRRRVRALEERLRIHLFTVDDQRLVLTAQGRALVARGGDLLAHSAEIEAGLLGSAVEADRPIVLTVAVFIGVHPFATAFVSQMVRQRHPDVRIEVVTCADPIAAVAEGADLVVHLGVLPDDSPLTARRIATLPFRLLAAPEYLALQGTPRSVDDLDAHTLILHRGTCPGGHLPLLTGGSVRVRPQIVSDDVHFCHQAARTGFGVAFGPTTDVPAAVDPSTPPVPVLEDLVGRDVPAWVLAPGRLSRRASVAAVVEDILAFVESREL